MLTGQNISYKLLPLRKFVLQEGISKKKKVKSSNQNKKTPKTKEQKTSPNWYFCGLQSNKVPASLPNSMYEH